MRNYIYLIIAGLLLTQCQKDSDFNDLGGSSILSGVVVIVDTLNGPVTRNTAPNLTVYLRYSSQVSGYLVSNKADALGQYTFNGIDPDSAYVVYAYTDTGAVKMYGQLSYAAKTVGLRKSDTLKLYAAQQTQNAIHLLVVDTTLAPVPNVTAWVFNSKVLFDADSSAGRMFDLPVNGSGVGNKFNLAAGTYYFRVKTRIGNMDVLGDTSAVVGATGITTVPLVLRNVTAQRNGIELTLHDIYGTPVNAATVYFYRLKSAYLADSVKAANYLFPLTSDAAGLAAIYNIDSATYYYRAEKIIGTDTLRATDSIKDMRPHFVSKHEKTME